MVYLAATKTMEKKQNKQKEKKTAKRREHSSGLYSTYIILICRSPAVIP